MKMKILLNSIDKVKGFSNAILLIPCDMDLEYGRYRIDAKSLLGIFSLDLTKELDLIIHTNDVELMKEISDRLKPFLA